MLRVFADAGLPVQRRMSDGVVELTFPLPGSEAGRGLDGYLESVAARESRADVEPACGICCTRQSVAVVEREPAAGNRGPGDLAQHRDRRVRRTWSTPVNPRAAVPGGPALPGVGR